MKKFGQNEAQYTLDEIMKSNESFNRIGSPWEKSGDNNKITDESVKNVSTGLQFQALLPTGS